MITVEKLEKGTYFDDAFKISFRYDPTTVAKVKELAERRYLPEDRAWEIPAHELPALIEKVGLSNIKSEEAVVQALNTKEIEDKREATQERLKGIKPVRDFDFKTAPLPHQIEAFNYGMEKNSLLIGDEQGLGKTKESSNSYEVLEETGDLKTNYWDYMTTEPINCNEELKRLESADYDLCSALLTMLLREDHFCNGAFDQRVESGQVERIVQRMIKLLEK